METLSFFNKVPHLNIIKKPTPAHLFQGVGEALGHHKLFIKREDLTHSIYGGNKVRNLEFLLADVMVQNSRRIATLAPVGSNFVAALAVQARLSGIPLDVFHFQPASSPLINAQVRFSFEQGAHLKFFGKGKYLSSIKAQIAMVAQDLRHTGTYCIAPGGSSLIGAIGHVRAVFELAGQIQRGEIPEPSVIVVGVGTCGTMAGMLAGIQLTGIKSKLIGVRCVDPLVCHRLKIATLANGVLKKMNSRKRVRMSEIDLRDVKNLSYGEPIEKADHLIAEVKNLSGVHLDTTYTTKVFSFLNALIESNQYKDQNILYWNTFSPKGQESSGLTRAKVNSNPVHIRLLDDPMKL